MSADALPSPELLAAAIWRVAADAATARALAARFPSSTLGGEVARLGALDPAARAAAIAHTLADATPGASVLARAEATWLADGLARLGPLGRAALAAIGDAAPPAATLRRTLEQGVVADLAPMPVGPAPVGRAPRPDELALTSGAVLERALETLGLRTIAPVFRAAPAGAAEALAAKLGAAAPAFRAAVAAAAPAGRDALARLAPLLAQPGPDLLARVGITAAAPGLAAAGDAIAAAVAQRLPRPLGRALLDAARAASPDAAALDALCAAVSDAR